jgi:acyl-CoA thioesterase-1
MMKAMFEITSMIRRLIRPDIRELCVVAALLLLLAGQSKRAIADDANILIMGDSLSSAYGLPLSEGWVALLQERLDSTGANYQVVNSSVTGDTSANGLSRLADLLDQHQPAIVIIELGGNDGLRGLSIKKLRSNLREMVTLATQSGAQTLLVGMQIPVNYGASYAKLFSESFATIADETGSSLVPFLLDGFELATEYFQDDGIHPNRQAQPLMLDNVWPVLETLL